jgi:alpha-N-acetylglucosamine transferase
LITNTAYLPGLITLDYSLKRAGSAYPLIALYTDSFPEEGHAALDARGIAKQRVEYLLPTKGKDYSNDPRFYDCWSKLTPFSLTEYDRVVQLDSDMLVLRNMDELMTLELDEAEVAARGNLDPNLGPVSRRVFAAGHACVCNPLKKAHYPKDWIPEHCAFTSQHGDPEEAQTVAADPAVGPLRFMNGGLQVVNPCKEIYSQILQYMEENASAMDFADQSLLSGLFWDRWVALPYTYNALKTLRWKDVHGPIWRDESVKNIHYILTPKPWDALDEQGNDTSGEETSVWWADINKERKKVELEHGISDDGF